MKDVIKKSVLLGLGVGALTKEKAEKFVKELQKKGYLDVKEGKKLARELMAESKKAQKKVQTAVEKQVKAAVKKMPLATKKDLKDLEKKVTKKKR